MFLGDPSTRYLNQCGGADFKLLSIIIDAIKSSFVASDKRFKSQEIVFSGMTFVDIHLAWGDFLRDLYYMTSKIGLDLSDPATLCFGLEGCAQLGKFMHRKMLNHFSLLVIEIVFFGVGTVYRSETTTKPPIALLLHTGQLNLHCTLYIAYIVF